MTKRFTDTGKWIDKWFRKLSVHQKLLFLWLIDNCDNAGFWEVDIELAAQQIGITETKARGAWQGLGRAFIEHGEYIWVIRYIRVQGNWPLNSDNNAHKQIISLLSAHSEFGIDFYSLLDCGEIIRPTLGPKEAPCKGKGKGHGHGHGRATDFQTFWAAYPRKVGKGNAQKWWKSHKPDEALLQTMLVAIGQQRKSDGWVKDGGQYIPHPATWLNGKRWEDELPPPKETMTERIARLSNERY